MGHIVINCDVDFWHIEEKRGPNIKTIYKIEYDSEWTRVEIDRFFFMGLEDQIPTDEYKIEAHTNLQAQIKAHGPRTPLNDTVPARGRQNRRRSVSTAFIHNSTSLLNLTPYEKLELRATEPNQWRLFRPRHRTSPSSPADQPRPLLGRLCSL